MKKWLVGSLVGAIIVFAWQAVSWMVMDLHSAEHKYTDAQDQILTNLNSSNLEEGTYMMPNLKPGSKNEQRPEYINNTNGKPWALITYVKAVDTGMANPMIMGFIIDLLLVILVISILVRGGLPSFIGIVTGCIAIGVFSFLWEPYMSHNWYHVPWSSVYAHLIDSIVAWGACGLWLGWWLRRPVNP
jgi:hypothetical protein